MSLPADQQRELGSIEDALQASEPGLASMFAIFTRLNKGEPVSAEALQPRSWWASRADTPMYALVVIGLVFAVIVGALIGGTAHGATTCGSQYQAGSDTSLLSGGTSLVSRPACTVAAKSTLSKAASPAPGAGRRSCPAQPIRQGLFPQPVPADVTTPGPPATC